jgi:excisionase family DNA binding protein
MLSGRPRKLVPMVRPLDRLHSAQEIADRLGVAEKTVRRWIDRGLLPAQRQGHAFAIRMEDAERVFAASPSSRAAGRGLEVESHVKRVEAELAELRGRYAETREQIARLERALSDERRRAAVLEVQLEVKAA